MFGNKVISRGPGYVEVEYRSLSGTPAEVTQAILDDLIANPIDVSSLDFYSRGNEKAYTLYFLARENPIHQRRPGEGVIPGGSITHPDKSGFQVDDTTPAIGQTSNFAGTFSEEDNKVLWKITAGFTIQSLLKAAQTTQAQVISVRVSTAITPDLDNPAFESDNISARALNQEAKRQDLIAQRYMESRLLFGSRDASTDPIASGETLPHSSQINRADELFVLTEMDGDNSAGVYYSVLDEHGDLQWRYVTRIAADSFSETLLMDETITSDVALTIDSTGQFRDNASQRDSRFSLDADNDNHLTWTARSGEFLILDHAIRAGQDPTVAIGENGRPIEVEGFGNISFVLNHDSDSGFRYYCFSYVLMKTTGDDNFNTTPVKLIDTYHETVIHGSSQSPALPRIYPARSIINSSSYDFHGDEDLYIGLKFEVFNLSGVPVTDNRAYPIDIQDLQVRVKRSPQFVAGRQGPRGERGEDGVQNPIREWVTGEFYGVDRLVVYGGAVYRCIVEHTAAQRFNRLYWDRVTRPVRTITSNQIIGTDSLVPSIDAEPGEFYFTSDTHQLFVYSGVHLFELDVKQTDIKPKYNIVASLEEHAEDTDIGGLELQNGKHYKVTANLDIIKTSKARSPSIKISFDKIPQQGKFRIDLTRRVYDSSRPPDPDRQDPDSPNYDPNYIPGRDEIVSTDDITAEELYPLRPQDSPWPRLIAMLLTPYLDKDNNSVQGLNRNALEAFGDAENGFTIKVGGETPTDRISEFEGYLQRHLQDSPITIHNFSGEDRLEGGGFEDKNEIQNIEFGVTQRSSLSGRISFKYPVPTEADPDRAYAYTSDFLNHNNNEEETSKYFNGLIGGESSIPVNFDRNSAFSHGTIAEGLIEVNFGQASTKDASQRLLEIVDNSLEQTSTTTPEIWEFNNHEEGIFQSIDHSHGTIDVADSPGQPFRGSLDSYGIYGLTDNDASDAITYDYSGGHIRFTAKATNRRTTQIAFYLPRESGSDPHISFLVNKAYNNLRDARFDLYKVANDRSLTRTSHHGAVHFSVSDYDFRNFSLDQGQAGSLLVFTIQPPSGGTTTPGGIHLSYVRLRLTNNVSATIREVQAGQRFHGEEPVETTVRFIDLLPGTIEDPREIDIEIFSKETREVPGGTSEVIHHPFHDVKGRPLAFSSLVATLPDEEKKVSVSKTYIVRALGLLRNIHLGFTNLSWSNRVGEDSHLIVEEYDYEEGDL